MDSNPLYKIKFSLVVEEIDATYLKIGRITKDDVLSFLPTVGMIIIILDDEVIYSKVYEIVYYMETQLIIVHLEQLSLTNNKYTHLIENGWLESDF